MFLKLSYWHWVLIYLKPAVVAQALSPVWSFMGHLIYWAEERTDSCVCGIRRNGSVWNPSKHTSMQIRMLQILKLLSVVFFDMATWTQLSSFISQRLGDVAVCPSFWQTRPYSWGGRNSEVKFRHAANWDELKHNQHWLLSIFYFQNMESN